MRDWVQRLGKNQKKVIQRLSKNAVRNHENIRLAGDGGAPAAQGSYAQAQGVQFQHTLQGYANQIPGVSQAQQIFGGGAGVHKGPSGGYPGAPPQQPTNTTAPPVTGQAASYYNEGKQPSVSSYSAGTPTSSYAPPPGPPPSFSGSAPSFPGSAPTYPGSPPSQAVPHHAGYSPSYSPSYSAAPPSFPGSAPSFPGGPPAHFPSAPSFPGTGPSFPGGPSPGHGPHQGGYAPPPGPPPGAPPFPGGAPGFPGANAYNASSPPPHFPGAPGSDSYRQSGW